MTTSNIKATPVVGNMFFQVCGGVESTLVALQADVFKNEAKLMISGTELAKQNFTLQSQESQDSFNATVASGSAQAENLRLQSYQSFITGGITLGGTALQIGGEKVGENKSELDELNTKLKSQEKLSEKMNPSAKKPLSSMPVSDDQTLANSPKEIPSAVQDRIQDLIGGGAAHPYNKFNQEEFPQGKNEQYDHTKGSYDVEGLDDNAISAMTDKQRADCYKSVQEQIKVTHQEIGVAQAKITRMRETVQSGVQLATQIASGTTQTLQATQAYQQQLQQAVATVQGQANSTTGATGQLEQKQREQASEEGRHSADAIMSSIVAANGRA